MSLQEHITNNPMEAVARLMPVPFQQESASVLPPKVLEALKQALTPRSPVDTIVQGMEALYAGLKVTAEFPDDLANVLGNLAHQVYTYRWHGKEDRAFGIYGFCLRVLGEGNQPVEQDPEPEAMYLEQEPAPEPTPAPEA